MDTRITPERLEALKNIVLERGKHEDQPPFCAMEAAAWLAGEPKTDHPECVCPVIASFCRSWNDSTDAAGREVLKDLLPEIIGSSSTPDVETKRAFVVADWAVRTVAAQALRDAGLSAEANKLASLPEITDQATASEAASYAVRAASEAARAASYAARAVHAASDAASYAARAASEAARAASYAVSDAARAASYAASEASYTARAAVVRKMLAVK
jgi:hypothetical protein